MLRALRVPAIVGVGVPLLSGFRDASCEGRGARKGAKTDDPLGASKVVRESFRPPEMGAFLSGRLKVEHREVLDAGHLVGALDFVHCKFVLFLFLRFEFLWYIDTGQLVD